MITFLYYELILIFLLVTKRKTYLEKKRVVIMRQHKKNDFALQSNILHN